MPETRLTRTPRPGVLLSLTAVLALGLAAAPAGAVDARMFRHPDVSATHLAFVYAGDVWVVPKEGGTASRLSSPGGEESFPRFSPDGRRLAYTASYDSGPDVYVVDADGGVPTRVTYHPAGDRLLDWIDDDRLLFASSRHSGKLPSQFFRVSAAGGLPEKLPVPYGEFGALHGDGRRFAYNAKVTMESWKRYRGGLAPDVWLFDLDSLEARNLTDSPAAESYPMWHGDRLYFLSDRGPSQRMNLWTMAPDSGDARQLTRFTDFDVTYPAIGPEDVVFQAGGRLYLFGLDDESLREVEVEVVTDRASLKPERRNVSELIAGAHVSPNGRRAVFEARGEVFTLPAKDGVVRQLTRSSGVAELFPAWSPDGEKIAYWSDRGGEYELALRAADGSGEEEFVTDLGPGYRYRPFWSPDSRKIAFLDHTLTFRILDLETREVREVDRGRQWLHNALQQIRVDWSSDGRWLAYWRILDNGRSAVFLFDTGSGSRHQVTSGYYSDSFPVFDPGGDYLYYRSSRSLQPVYSDLDATWVYPETIRLVAVPLRADVPSPLAPRNDDEGDGDSGGSGEEDEDRDENGDGDGKGEEDKDEKPVEIDLEGFETRAVVLPPAAGNYGRIEALSGKLLYHRLPRPGDGSGTPALAFYDFEEREEKAVLDGVRSFELAAGRDRLLVELGGGWAIVGAEAGVEVEDRLATGELETVVDPRAEWRQMYREVWRAYRDDFYDPGLHGLDWEAVGESYGRLLEDAVTRWDVDFVFRELVAEVNASHTFIFGGDVEAPDGEAGVGLLGVDWELGDGAYRIARIVRGGPWDAERRSPLAEPGVDVAEGDYVLAVDGRPLDPARAPHAAFQGLAGRTVELTVNDAPSLDGARRVVVETLASEEALRTGEWVEGRRRYVEEATGGRVGYVYVPDTGAFSGQTELVRQFTGQATKEGLIVDERWNSGGQLADRFVELMTRRRIGHIYFRHAGTQLWPSGTHYGPKAMVINGWAGSGGDSFPWAFRQMEAGPIVGERTWGGLIGPALGRRLIDGGVFTAPPGRLYHVDGRWFEEGHGVEPDVPVADDPGELARGRDPQLDAAVAEVLRRLEAGDGPRFPPRPAWEKRVPE